MANLNRVFLIGNLTRDPELRYIPNGTAVANLGMAINRRYKDASGNLQEEVCYVTVVLWGRQAETANQYLKKGNPLFVEGRLSYRTWEKDGQKRSTLEVRGERMQFLGGKREDGPSAAEPSAVEPEEESGEGAARPATANASTPPSAAEDVPF